MIDRMSVYPMHGGAKGAFYTAGGLCCLLIITIPVGIWFIIKAAGARVELSDTHVVQRGLTTVKIAFADVTRLGILEVAVVGGGIGGAIARKKCGGRTAIHLCTVDARGKNRRFMASMYGNYQEIIDRVAAATGKPVERLSMGVMGPKWPEAAAA